MRTRTKLLNLLAGLAFMLLISISVFPLGLGLTTASAGSQSVELKNGLTINEVIAEGYYKINTQTDWSFPANWEKGSSSDYTFHWDKSSKKLTLNNCNIKLGKYERLICDSDVLTIELKGSNSIVLWLDDRESPDSAIYNREGHITFVGNGKLDIKGEESGTYYQGGCVKAKNVTVKGSVNLNLLSDTANDSDNPLRVTENIYIYETPTITLKVINTFATAYSSAMYAGKGYIIKGSPKMTLYSANGHGMSAGSNTSTIELYDGGYIDIECAKTSKKAIACTINDKFVPIFDPTTGYGSSLTDNKIKLMGAGKMSGQAVTPPSGTDSQTVKNNAKEGISAGAVVGVVLTSVVVLSASAYVAGYFYLYKKGKIANATVKSIFQWADRMLEKLSNLIKIKK